MTSPATTSDPLDPAQKQDALKKAGLIRPTKTTSSIPEAPLRKAASLSLDLDNKWSYMKTHGDAGWEKFPSYLDVVVPRFLEIFRQRNLTLTVFVVGQDAALEKNREALSSISAAGHEIGNHSFHHEPWLHLYERQQLRDEFDTSEEAIFQATGQKTIGFRGPGFSISRGVINELARRGYQYDGTIFATYLGPLARAYYFMTSSSLSAEDKQRRKQLFGKFRDGFRPNRPFHWQFDDQSESLVEIPVTTMPVFKAPIHLSYLLYLAKFSRLAMRLYLWKTIRLCKLFGVAPSFLLHPLDFMGKEDDADLAFFPAMDQPLSYKLDVAAETFDALQKHFNLFDMRTHAQIVRTACQRTKPLSILPPEVI